MIDQRRRVGLFVISGILLLLGLALFKPAVGLAAIAAATRTATSTPQPTMTSTPNATVQWEAQLAQAQLQMHPRAICPGKPYYIGCYLLQQLDFLYRYPHTPYLEKVIERTAVVIGYGGYKLKSNWLIDDWLDRIVAQAFQAAGKMPAGLEEQWKSRLQFIEADLDNNYEPDYLVKAFFRSDISDWDPFHTGLYWLGRVGERYIIEPIEEGYDLDFEIVSHQDLNGDGYHDLAYTTRMYSSNSGAKEFHLLTRKSGEWQTLPILVEPTYQRYDDWSAEILSDGSSELIALNLGGHFWDYGDNLSYQIHYRWAKDQFTPIRISLAADYRRLQEPAAFEWVNLLIETHQFTEALRTLKFTAENKSLAPYALFRQGMIHLYLRDATSARNVWERLQNEYPDQPVTQSVSALLQMTKKPEDIWRVCAWLKQNVDRWLPPGMTEENAEELPILDRSYWSPHQLCRTNLLVEVGQWSRLLPLERQAAQTGLAFKLLSTDYDLDGDQQPDPIAAMGGSIWAFLPDGNRWRPVLASRGLYQWHPPTYGDYSIPDTGIRVTDLDANGRPEILLWDAADTLLSEWDGHQFQSQRLPRSGRSARLSLKSIGGRQYTIQMTVFDSDKPDAPTGEETYQLRNGIVTRLNPPPDLSAASAALSNAIEAMYRNRNPRQALSLLKGYASADPWEAGLARYLEA
ncbi:MAG: hypothetical protein HY870_18830, partial [Chloroflexi bacterium]|nr:hypothetical protein [Chloroflexota bacterium]